MAMIRMREVIAVGRTGETFVGPEGYTWELSLADLYAMTTPEPWDPVMPTLEDWVPNAEIDRARAQEITTELNNTQPWEQSGGGGEG